MEALSLVIKNNDIEVFKNEIKKKKYMNMSLIITKYIIKEKNDEIVKILANNIMKYRKIPKNVFLRIYQSFNKRQIVRDSYNSILGVVIGMGLGDALGVPFERQIYKISKDIVYTGKLEHRMIGFNRFKKKYWKTAVGQISDDTEMMITIINTLIKNKGIYNKEDMILAYMEWANSPNSKFMGRTTRNLFLGVKTISGYNKRYIKYYPDNKSKQKQQSNGALMRCGILAILGNKDVITDCKITNPSNVCLEAELIYIEAIRYSMDGKTKDQIYQMCKHKTKESVLKIALDQAKNGTQRNISEKGKIGWVAHGYYSAFYALFNFNTYSEAIRSIILMGGDTDTNACIAGGLLGAFYGFNKLYKKEKYNIDVLLENRVLKGDGDVPRPKKYTLDKIKEKIKLLMQNLVISEKL